MWLHSWGTNFARRQLAHLIKSHLVLNILRVREITWQNNNICESRLLSTKFKPFIHNHRLMWTEADELSFPYIKCQVFLRSKNPNRLEASFWARAEGLLGSNICMCNYASSWWEPSFCVCACSVVLGVQLGWIHLAWQLCWQYVHEQLCIYLMVA